MDKVTISFQYGRDEYIKAFRKYLFLSKIIKKSDLIILGGLFVLESILIAVTGFHMYSLVLGLILSFFAMILGMIYFYQPVNIYRRTPKFHQIYKLTFTKEGIDFKTDHVNSFLAWEIYKDIWESNDFYYLLQNKRIYTIIPKRVLQGRNTKSLKDILQAAGPKFTKLEA